MALLCTLLGLAWVVGLLGPDAFAGDTEAAVILGTFAVGPLVGLLSAAWYRYRDRATASLLMQATAAATLTCATVMAISSWLSPC